MVEVVAGTNGPILLPDPARCPRHPSWHIAIRRFGPSSLNGEGKPHRQSIRTGECPECGWKPNIDRLDLT